MSYIVCTAEKVTHAAAVVIEDILTERKARDEKHIVRAMAKKHFWSRKPFTREDAIDWLDNHKFCWRSMYAWDDLEKAKQLLILAKHGDPVTVHAEYAIVLWG